jgi:hypothetical protein
MRKIRRSALLAGILLCSSLLFADDHNVDFDLHVDFSKIKTFTIRQGKIDSPRPELKNALVQRRMADAIRASLTSKGLKETADRPNVTVEFSVSHVDYSVGPFGVARPIGEQRGRGGRGDPQSTDPVGFVEGLLVVDMNQGDSGLLIWRGVYRDREGDSTRFSEKLPSDAKTLLSQYPPKKK